MYFFVLTAIQMKCKYIFFYFDLQVSLTESNRIDL